MCRADGGLALGRLLLEPGVEVPPQIDHHGPLPRTVPAHADRRDRQRGEEGETNAKVARSLSRAEACGGDGHEGRQEDISGRTITTSVAQD